MINEKKIVFSHEKISLFIFVFNKTTSLFRFPAHPIRFLFKFIISNICCRFNRSKSSFLVLTEKQSKIPEAPVMRCGRRPRKQGMLNIEDGPGKPGQVPAAGVQPVNEKPILTYPVPEKAGKWPHAWREKLRLNLLFCKSRGLSAGIAQTFEA